MRVPYTNGWHGGVMLVVGLGMLLCLLGPVQGQERPPESGAALAVLEEAQQLDAQAIQLYSEGKYAAALPLTQRALTLREQLLGPQHPDVANTLNNLARLYKAQGEYRLAASLYQRALAIQEQVLGPWHPDVAIILNNLADLYKAQGEYQQAASLYQRALAIQEQALGSQDPQVAIILSNLAKLYEVQGEYQQAAPLYQRALAIQEQALGPQHPDVASTLNNLAVLDEALGHYRQAETYYRRALAMREQTLGPQHPHVAISLNNLAKLYQAQGDSRQAAPLYQRALAIQERALGPQHPYVATTLNNLAVLYKAQGHYQQAALLYERALTIQEQVLGPHHPEVANILNNLAELQWTQGKYQQAEALYQRTLAIQEQILGSLHPDVAITLSNLAVLYRAQGKYQQAETLYQRTLAIQEQVLGPHHPEVATTLTLLAVLYQAQGDVARAVAVRRRGMDLHEQTLANLLTIGSEAQKQAYLRALEGSGSTSATVSLHTQAAPQDPAALRLALTTVLRRKGRVLDAMLDTLATLRRQLAPADQVLLTQWTAARTRLATLLQRGPDAQDPTGYRGQLAALEAQAQALEAQLSARSAEFQTQTAPVTLAAVQQHLPPEAALVEVVWYRPFQPRAAAPAEIWGTARYVAYILRSQGEPQWVDLGEAARLDRAVLRLRRALSCAPETATQDPEQEQVRERCLTTRLPQLRTYARQLDEQLMRPLLPLLGDARLLLLVPDGTLNLLPFGALVDEHQHYRIEHFTINYLTSGRDVLRGTLPGPSRQHPLVVANPAFDDAQVSTALVQRQHGFVGSVGDGLGSLSRWERAGGEGPQVPDKAPHPNPLPEGEGTEGTSQNQYDRVLELAAAEHRASALRAVHLANLHFTSLPGTAEEAQALHRLLPEVRLLTGSAATKSALKQVQGPRLLHVATHGFFLTDAPPSTPTEERGIGPAPSGEAARPWAGEPLMRSGLALAGANVRQRSPDDGILTALEAAGLDLWGTELVVLSACETGVGTVQNGEGVYGLRRALVMAGAQSQVMSLWKVDDVATQAFMTAYYRRLLAGAGRAEAMRQTQRELLAQAVWHHPLFWASFVPVGEWRSLEGTGRPQP